MARWCAAPLLLLGCAEGDASHPGRSAAPLETVEPSLALPSSLPELSGEKKEQAVRTAILASDSLDKLLERAAGRFGDEHQERKYAALRGPEYDGRTHKIIGLFEPAPR